VEQKPKQNGGADLPGGKLPDARAQGK